MIISLLLKKALPFMLTFVVGTALGGLTWLFGGSEKKAETVVVTRTYDFKSRCGNARSHKLVAESKPLVINFTPDARYPGGSADSVRVNVIFGADGEVAGVMPLSTLSDAPDGYRVMEKAKWEAVGRAARQIRFTPETINGVPVTVEREVEIRLFDE